jgi:hypothetical protein
MATHGRPGLTPWQAEQARLRARRRTIVMAFVVLVVVLAFGAAIFVQRAGHGKSANATVPKEGSSSNVAASVDLSSIDKYTAIADVGGRLVLSGPGGNPAGGDTCDSATLNPTTLALTGVVGGSCADPSTEGRRVVPVFTVEPAVPGSAAVPMVEVQISHVSPVTAPVPSIQVGPIYVPGLPGSPGYTLGPTVMSFPDKSSHWPSWTYGDGYLWLYFSSVESKTRSLAGPGSTVKPTSTTSTTGKTAGTPTTKAAAAKSTATLTGKIRVKPSSQKSTATGTKATNPKSESATESTPMLSGELLKVSASTGLVVQTLRLPDVLHPIFAVDDDGLWIAPPANGAAPAVYHVGLKGSAAAPVFHLASGSYAAWMVAAGHSVWLAVSSSGKGWDLWQLTGNGDVRESRGTLPSLDNEVEVAGGASIMVGNAAGGLWTVVPNGAGTEQVVIRVGWSPVAFSTIASISPGYSSPHDVLNDPWQAVMLDG